MSSPMLNARKGTLSLAHAREAIIRGLHTKQVPMLLGQSGVGKSAVIDELPNIIPNSILIRLTLVNKEAYDFAGIPDAEEWQDAQGKQIDKRMVFLKPGLIPLEGDERNTKLIPPGTEMIIIFIDEVPEGDEPTLKALYSILNERMVDDRPVHSMVRFVCAGNRAQDGNNTKQLIPAFANRMLHITVQLSVQEWVTYAAKKKVLPEIRAFISNNPQHLHTYEADSKASGGCGEAWGSPRSWMNLDKYLQGHNGLPKLDVTDSTDLVALAAPAAFVGELAGQQFIDYTSSTNLPDINVILNDPLYDVNRLTIGEMFLLGQSLISIANPSNIKDVLRVMDALPGDTKAINFMTLPSMSAELYAECLKQPVFLQFASKNKQLLSVLRTGS